MAIKSNYNLGNETKEPLVTPALLPGHHGYLPELADMNSSFFIVGPGIAAARSLGLMDMRDIAPTLGRILGVRLPAAEGKDVLQ